MNRAMFLGIAAAAFLSGCSSLSVNSDYNETTDFTVLKTYAWQHAEQPQTGNPQIDNDLIDERVRAAINTNLAAKGFQLVDAAVADFQVAYFVEYKQRIGSSNVSVGVGAGSYGRYGGVSYGTDVYDYEEGFLTIDIINPQDGKNFWRGIGRRTSYQSSNPKKITKVVNQSVAGILRRFPPK